jgi:hypothetical protein
MDMMDSSAGFGGERRIERRRRVLRGAMLRFHGGLCAMEGLVRNESEHGVQLSFGDATGVPSSFDLAINGAGRVRAARVCWRSQTLVGVQFAD